MRLRHALVPTPSWIGCRMGEIATEESVRRIRCVVIQEDMLFSQLLCCFMHTGTGVEVVAAGTSLDDVRRMAAIDDLDLVILGSPLNGDDGFDSLRALRSRHPRIKCVVLSKRECLCPDDVSDCIVATVATSQAVEDLIAAIEHAAGDEVYRGVGVVSREDIVERLTRRELNVFDSLGKGLSNKEIATALSISVQTVETHRKSISRKLGVNGASLVRMATLSRSLTLR